MSTVAVCAGSGSSVLNGAKADLYVTGQYLHQATAKEQKKPNVNCYPFVV